MQAKGFCMMFIVSTLGGQYMGAKTQRPLAVWQTPPESVAQLIWD